MQKPALLGLVVLALVSSAHAQRSPAASAPHLPTYVTQLGLTHFPAGEASLGDYVAAVEVLRDGSVVVAGRTYGSLGELHSGLYQEPDIFVARFDRLGSVEWIRQIGAITAPTIPALNGNPGGPGGGANGYDYAGDLAVAPDGSIYVTGYAGSHMGETMGGMTINGDVFLAKLDPYGALQWLRQLGDETTAAFGGHGGQSIDPWSYEEGSSVVVDPSGAVYVAGYTGGSFGENSGNPAGGQDVFLARFSTDGRLEWVRQMGWVSSALVGFDSKGWDYSPRMALHPSGSIVVACTSEFVEWWPTFTVSYYVTLFTFDERGNPLASKELPGTDSEELADLAVDPSSGRIFVTGPIYAGGSGNAFVASLDGDLRLEWWLGPEAGIGFVSGLCVDAAGDLILAGSTTGFWSEPSGGAADVFTAKLRGSDGELVWASQIGKTTSALHGLDAKGPDYASDLALGPRDTIVIAGTTEGNLAEPNAGEFDVIAMRLNPNGSL